MLTLKAIIMTHPLQRNSVKQLLLLLIILGIALALRLWQIDQLPPGFHFDEAFEGLEAWRILTDPAYRPVFLTGNFGVPPLNSYANALTFAFWRAGGGVVGPTAMRVTAALFGCLGVVAIYGLASELRRTRFGFTACSAAFPLLAALVLATMRWHIHFSRMGIEPIIVPLIWTLTTWFFLYGWRSGHFLAFAGSGVILAAGMYAYQGAWFIPFLLLVTLLILLIDRWRRREQPAARLPSLRRALSGTLVTGLVAAVLFAPLAWFFVNHIDLVFLRPAQLSIVGETTSPADSGLAASLWATVKMFGPFGSPGDSDPRRNLPGAPALTLWYALPFYVGLALTIWRAYQPAAAIILLGLVGLLLPGVMSEYAPHFHRILGAAAPTALLCAIGLDWLWQWRPRPSEPLYRALGPWLVIFILVSGTLREAQNYFVRWAALPDLFHAFDVGLWQVGQEIAAQPADTPIYLTPRTADHATLAFAWETRPDAHPAPTTFDGRQIFPLTAGSTIRDERYVVIADEDFRTPLLLPGLFPDAMIAHKILDATGKRYASSYRRPANSTIAREPQVFLHEDKSPERIGDGISLLGYDVQPSPLVAGGILYLQLYWLVDAPPTDDWTIFTHLLQPTADGSSSLVAGYDSQPGGGSLPTSAWLAGWQILDEYQIVLPADLPAGEYQLATGLYQANGKQLPPVDDAAAGRIMLGSVRIE